MKPNLELDLMKSDEIANKCIHSDVYSQNLYSSLCNNRFFYGDEEWSCSWRSAAGIVADLRNKGETYIDFYCSGMSNKEGYVAESVVTEEISLDLMKLGWTIKSIMFGDIIKYEEKTAKNKKGFLLYSPFREAYFLRIYDGDNFKDYELFAEEIEIQLIDKWISLYESEEKNKVDFSTKALGKE